MFWPILMIKTEILAIVAENVQIRNYFKRKVWKKSFIRTAHVINDVVVYTSTCLWKTNKYSCLSFNDLLFFKVSFSHFLIRPHYTYVKYLLHRCCEKLFVLQKEPWYFWWMESENEWFLLHETKTKVGAHTLLYATYQNNVHIIGAENHKSAVLLGRRRNVFWKNKGNSLPKAKRKKWQNNLAFIWANPKFTVNRIQTHGQLETIKKSKKHS